MPRTPKTQTSNDPQKVFKTIEEQEEISLSIRKQVTGNELNNVLSSITAFTQGFNMDDKYELEVKVVKIIHPPEESVVNENADK